MPNVVAGAIRTFQAPVRDVRVGDRVRREMLILAAGHGLSIRVTTEPVRHGSVWMIHGMAGNVPVSLYPIADELVWITRAEAASADPERTADVHRARHLRGGA